MHSLNCAISGMPISPGSEVILFLLEGEEMMTVPVSARYNGYGEFTFKDDTSIHANLAFLKLPPWSETVEQIRVHSLQYDVDAEEVRLAVCSYMIWKGLATRFADQLKPKNQAALLKGWIKAQYPLEAWIKLNAMWMDANPRVFEFIADSRDARYNEIGLEVRAIHVAMQALGRAFAPQAHRSDPYPDLAQHRAFLDLCLEHIKTEEEKDG